MVVYDDGMCCPSCAGHASVNIAIVTAYRARTIVTYALTCLECSLVSEVGCGGGLLDLGDINVRDLFAFHNQHLMTAPTHRSQWRDS